MKPLNFLVMLFVAAAFSSCAAVQSKVTRFHSLPVKGSGQTFTVRNSLGSSSLEYSTYVARVTENLKKYGWTPAPSGSADYMVSLNYRTGGSRQKVGSTPVMGQTGGGTTYHSGSVNSYGSYGSNFGSYSGSSYTPATYGVVGSRSYSKTVHDRFLNLRIVDKSGSSVFEGRVNSTGSNSDIAAVLPTMIDSLFTGFPGKSGKTKTIAKTIR